MAGIIYSGDWLQHHTKMISEGFKVDRIITDIPSFDGRWNGANGVQGIGTIRDLVSATVRAGEKMIDNPDGTMTISCTGIAQEKLNEWLAQQSVWELMPDSTWAMFRPYMRKASTNEHFWGRRDDWTYVQTFRKVGSPFHKGEHDAKERQKWLGKKGISYEEVELSDRGGLKVVGQLGSDAHFTDGYVVQFSTDPADWHHITKRITQLVSLGLDTQIKEMFEGNKFRGCRQLAGGNHKHVMLSMWMIATHTNAGEKVLDPFCGMGSTGAACAIMGRDFVGVEMNKTRKDIAQNAFDELFTKKSV